MILLLDRGISYNRLEKRKRSYRGKCRLSKRRLERRRRKSIRGSFNMNKWLMELQLQYNDTLEVLWFADTLKKYSYRLRRVNYNSNLTR